MADKGPFSDSGPVTYVPDEQVSAHRTEAEASLRRIPGVRGIGEGNDSIGDPAWVVYVTDPSVASQLPATVAGRRVVPEVTGEIDILPVR
jgi:hypothetical protein